MVPSCEPVTQLGRRSVLALVAATILSVPACSGIDASAGNTVARGPGFDGRTITVGVLAPRTGVFAHEGNGTLAGNELYWKALNARGGVAGKYRVKVDAADTESFESVAVGHYDEMIRNIVAFNQINGTKSVIATLPRLRRDGVIAIPAASDGRWVREPRLLPVGAPPEVQAANAVAYWHEVDGRGPLCSLHQDDTYGTGGYQGAEAAATGLGVPIAVSTTFTPIPADLPRTLDELRRAGCTTVLFIGVPFQATLALGAAQQVGYAPRWLLTAGSWSPSMVADAALGPYLAEHAWVVGEGTAWGDSAAPGMRALVAAQKRFAPRLAPGADVVDGYIQAWLLHRVLALAVAHNDLSRHGIRNAAGELARISFGGLAGPYRYRARAVDRQPPRASTVFAVDPSRPGGLRVLRHRFTTPSAASVPLPKPPQ